VDMLARIGAVILLFEVGLESTVAQMLKLGSPHFWCLLGVVMPFCLGWGVACGFCRDRARTFMHFSARRSPPRGRITARVLEDLGRSQSTEARIILGQR